MWDVVDKSGREDYLKESYLKPLLNRGASILRFMNTRESAVEILSQMMNREPELSRRPEPRMEVKGREEAELSKEGRLEHGQAEPQSTSSSTSIEDDDFVPSATPEPSSITVQLYSSLATSTPDDHEFVPSAAPEPSFITVPLFRLPLASTSADDDDFVPAAAPEPSSIIVPLFRLPASSAQQWTRDDFAKT